MSEEHPLRKWRKEKKLTQSQVAKLFGVSAWMVSALETGARKPSFEIAINIQRATKNEIMPIDFA